MLLAKYSHSTSDLEFILNKKSFPIMENPDQI